MFKTPAVPTKRKSSEEEHCSECGSMCAAYRCPGCGDRYCSLGCCQVHKEHCTPPAEPNSTTAGAAGGGVGGGDPTEEGGGQPKRQRLQIECPVTNNAVVNAVFEKVDGDPQLQMLLNSPDLRAWMKLVDGSMDPKAAVQEAMRNAEFRNFANQVLALAPVDKYFEMEGVE